MAYQRYTAEQWQQLIEQQADSGHSQVAFCAAHGLAKSTFQYWKRRLMAETTSSNQSSTTGLFTTLLEASDGATGEAASAPGWTIELDLGDGLCLRLRRES